MDEDIIKKLEKLDMLDDTDENGYFSRYVPETTGIDPADDVWDQLCEIQNGLEKVGLKLEDVYTDHDTIEGQVMRV